MKVKRSINTRVLLWPSVYQLIFRILILVCLGLFGAISAAQAQRPEVRDDESKESGQKVKLSFVILGCNRIQEMDWEKTKATNPSSANVPQLRQTFADITHLDPLPPYVFFTGDLVVNLDQGGDTLQGQLDAWVQLFRADPSRISQRITLIPMTGNHEVLQGLPSDASLGAKVEVLNPAAKPVWLEWLSRNGFDRFAGNGPTNAAPNPDMLVGDESRMTYSFDIGDTHFVILNTDTLNSTLNIGWVAYNWIQQDIIEAERNTEIKSIFVLGHKPIIGPIEAVEPGNVILNPLSFRLAALLNSSRKVKAYLCAHAHLWEARQLAGPHSAWQIVAGNAGSKLVDGWDPPGGPFFGFTLVKLYENGKVGVISYRRRAPKDYLEDSAEPAKPEPEIFLTRRSRRELH